MLDPIERIARAQRAADAWEEFFAPVVNDMREEYMRRLLEVSTKDLSRDSRGDKQTALSTAITLLDNVSSHVLAIAQDGEMAKKDRERMEKRLNLTGPQRRLLDLAR